jgi:protein associated with RNAse G/E
MIVSKKGNKFYYYINIASPFIYEEEIIKYIDFDLDFRVPDAKGKSINLLDLDEFHEHSIKYKYPEKLIAKIKEVQVDVLKKFNDGKFQHFLDFELIYRYDNLKENGIKDGKAK